MEPFTLSVPESVLEDLRRRLVATRWTNEPLGASDPSAGLPVEYLRELVDHWATTFDWRAQERALSRLPQFIADVDGTAIHLLHVRGAAKSSIPLLFTHGWPGSFLEALEIIPLLTTSQRVGDRDICFDVIVPSIPGFGFSEKPSRAGMTVFRIADLWATLMSDLGYERFAVQGGDWGASISTALALRHPERLIGMHLNYIPGSYRPFIDVGSRSLSAAEEAHLRAADAWYESSGGYSHVQRTRPLTLGYALNDSPAGLAAWIVEKFRDWSDCDGEVERRFTKDELLTNVMIYWVTGTAHSAARIYLETRRQPLVFSEAQRVTTPTAVLRCAHEAPFPPREWVERGYNVVRWTEHGAGGHFAALEEPEALVRDVRAFFADCTAAVTSDQMVDGAPLRTSPES
jgi:pimeloyl-ACP methyl ester carboxylesterase